MNIYCHNNVFADNASTNEYYRIITQAINEGRKKRRRKDPEFVYYEVHHVLPKSIFPEYSRSKWNLVLLRASEHLQCHKLLLDMVVAKLHYYPMVRAYWSMATRKTKDMHRAELTPEEYEDLRTKFAEAQVILGQKPCKIATKKKISLSNKGKAPAALTISNSIKARKGKKRPAAAVKASADAQKGNTNVRGKTWWNNGSKSTLSFTCPGLGYVKGRLTFTTEHRANIGKAQEGNTKKKDWAAKRAAGES